MSETVRILRSLGYHGGTLYLGTLVADSLWWLVAAFFWWAIAGIVLLFTDSGLSLQK